MKNWPERFNIISIEVLGNVVALRCYTNGSRWGWRTLGQNRYALDFGSLSLIFEHYRL